MAFLLSNGAAFAQEPTLAFICERINGFTSAAPKWNAETDGYNDQKVLLHFKGTQALSEIKWFKANKAYYEAQGLGLGMASGFSISIFGDEYVETYVYNAGTAELLFTMVRSGSRLLPNALKTSRGTCAPAGAMVR